MAVELEVKTERGRKAIQKVTNRYIEVVGRAPFHWRNGRWFIIPDTQVTQSILEAIVDEVGEEFFKHFTVSGYLTVGGWLFGKVVRAEDFIKEYVGVV